MMQSFEQIESNIFHVSATNFEKTALDIFKLQYQHNPIYQRYCKMLNIDSTDVQTLCQIPFLPISLFKQHDITTTTFVPEVIFESSGTTGVTTSKHLVKSAALYEQSFMKGFEYFYGNTNQYSILGLLPSYLERGNSSLVYMVDHLMQQTKHPCNFYLNDHDKLYLKLKENEQKGISTLLMGVTYALLDFASQYPMQLKHTIVMETGGMKGRKEEMTREDVHASLKNQLGLEDVHSEYGMTELLSQAYSKKNGVFDCPPWMNVLARNEEDPFDVSLGGKSAKGVANIIDLSNLYSCSFIATDDLVNVHENGQFEILGRLDNADVRGCSLLYIN